MRGLAGGDTPGLGALIDGGPPGAPATPKTAFGSPSPICDIVPPNSAGNASEDGAILRGNAREAKKLSNC